MIPGGITVSPVDQNNQRVEMTSVQWNYVFLSSVLRSFDPIPVPCYRICKELDVQSVKEDFLLVV